MFKNSFDWDHSVLKIPIAQKVFTMENHDGAYHAWKEAGVKQRILIHMDAHHDMWFIRKNSQMTIANFICKAIEEDLVNQVFWVVPDQTWESEDRKRPVMQHLKELLRRYPGRRAPIRKKEDRILTVIMERPLTVCTLDRLPAFHEDTLLDIDVDYLVIPFVSYNRKDTHGTLPWCWPDELVSRLASGQIHSDLITIAYSVEGGYTPLKWKYLGDELAARLNGEPPTVIKGMEQMKEAAILAQRGDRDHAEEMYREARKLLPDSPAPDYHSALLSLARGKEKEARAFYRAVVTKDPSYRTAYSNSGRILYQEKKIHDAEGEYRKMLLLDPDNAYAHLGLGLIAMKRKRWEEAEKLFEKTLELNAHLTDAYSALGDLFARKGRKMEAIAAYEKSLQLSLGGHKTLDALILTPTKENFLNDPDHYRVHAKLAKLEASKGMIAEAIGGYRMSIAGGHCDFQIYGHLAILYLRVKKWRLTLESFWNALKNLPVDLARSLRLIQ